MKTFQNIVITIMTITFILSMIGFYHKDYGAGIGFLFLFIIFGGLQEGLQKTIDEKTKREIQELTLKKLKEEDRFGITEIRHKL